MKKIFRWFLLVALVLAGSADVAQLPQTEQDTISAEIQPLAFPQHYKLDTKLQKTMLHYAALDHRLSNMIQHAEQYPVYLFKVLDFNYETINFVTQYPLKKDQKPATTIGEFKKGEYPKLLQWDERWGYTLYGDNFIGVGGCGPTALSMVIAGLTGKSDITPASVAAHAEKKGYYVNGIGTSWELMDVGGEAFGVKAKAMGTDRNSIYARLKEGKPIICSMSKGIFTNAVHFIVLTGLEKGRILINDPNSILHSNISWNLKDFEDQIAAAWYFEKK